MGQIKVVNSAKKHNSVLFSELSVGETFRIRSCDGYLYVKVSVTKVFCFDVGVLEPMHDLNTPVYPVNSTLTVEE